MSFPVYVFGRSSCEKRDTCHSALISVLNLAIQQSHVDFSVVWGKRGQVLQNQFFEQGTSKTPWPDSQHNCALPDGSEDPDGVSNAFDVAPYVKGIPWQDEGAFYMLAGSVLNTAKQLGIELVYGGDWDRDGLTEDQKFRDLGHFQGVNLQLGGTT